ncbi:MAG: alpha/beta fold hydrolase [Acidobacteriales bacterium]|nr:alpha/beta fold hydrolase [Terriglobales bacterium]
MQKVIEITVNSSAMHNSGLAKQAFDAYVASGEKAIAPIWGNGLFMSPRLEDLFPEIATPTLILWGAEDKLFPSALAPGFNGQIPGSRDLLIPHAGHFPHIDNPEATIGPLSDYPILPFSVAGAPVEENHTCWGLPQAAEVLHWLRSAGLTVSTCWMVLESAKSPDAGRLATGLARENRYELS